MLPARTVGLGLLYACGQQPIEHRPADRSAEAGDAYASSRACAGCHPDAFDSWWGSYHRTMTQPATPASVLPDWEGVTLERGPLTYRLLREGDRFLVDIPAYGSQGATPEERLVLPVVMTTGAHHMQLYWLPVPWLGEGAPAGADAYAARCAGCHEGEITTAPRIAGAAWTPPELRAALAPGRHPPVEGGAALEEALTFAARIQLDGRLTQFPFAWFVREGRWIHEEDTFLQPPREEEPFETYGEHWSDGCDRCHAVGPRYHHDTPGTPGEAAVADLGVACEACHGPAAAHAEAYRSPARRYAAHLDPEHEVDDVVDPRDLDPSRASAVCGQCHAELHPLGTRNLKFTPGQSLEEVAGVIQWDDTPDTPWLKEALAIEPRLMENVFWRDGTIRIAGRDYNGMAISACHTAGDLSCLSCHSMHDYRGPDDQLAPDAGSACAGCHPALAEDVEAHTHHPAESAGSVCENCHMPHTTLGLLNAMRSHRIDSPSAAVSASTGRPNACNVCHLDRSLVAVADDLERLWGAGGARAAGLSTVGASATTPAAVDWLLRGDAAQRAVTAWHMGWAPALEASGAEWPAIYLARLLDDPYVAVRHIAGVSLRRQPGFEDFEYAPDMPPARRAAARMMAEALWAARSGGLTLPALRIEGGRLDEAWAERMELVRDERPVTVDE